MWVRLFPYLLGPKTKDQEFKQTICDSKFKQTTIQNLPAQRHWTPSSAAIDW